MARTKKTASTSNRPIESYEHRDKQRVNNPPVGLVTPETDPDAGRKNRTYAYDPHLDPQLVWAGKAEHTSFEVPTVSLHVHERIAPRTIIEAVKKRNNGIGEARQLTLFEQERQEPLREAIEFYQHQHGWSNRLVAGDSLLVMNSLLEKEGMAGKVQMIYIDPPYGIRYGSNFQPFVNKRDVKDGKDEDLTAEPEQIRAFRDTWELGIHSYLTYLRDRLLLARELLTESGSVFVQIGDENVHLVRNLMDEVLGANNFCAQIAFRTSVPLTSAGLAGVSDYLLWYAKNKDAIKYRYVFAERAVGEGTVFTSVQLPDGTRRAMTPEERAEPKLLPKGARVFGTDNLVSSGYTPTCIFPIEYNGRKFDPTSGKSWKTNRVGIEALKRADRLSASGKTLRYLTFVDDYPVMKLSNLWTDTKGESEKVFVVQTSAKVIERCMLMTTDPRRPRLRPDLRQRDDCLRCRAMGPPLDHLRYLPRGAHAGEATPDDSGLRLLRAGASRGGRRQRLQVQDRAACDAEIHRQQPGHQGGDDARADRRRHRPPRAAGDALRSALRGPQEGARDRAVHGGGRPRAGGQITG
nr:site-specific DNA-methyltransferase [Tautonia sociabilis]